MVLDARNLLTRVSVANVVSLGYFAFEFPPGNLVTRMSLKVRKNRSEPPPGRCPLSECMAVIAGAWAPNVIWYLRGGPRRFSELRVDIPQVSAKVLSQRLRELEERGVILRHVQPTKPPSVEYSLTPLGHDLVPALQAIAEVGIKLKAAQKSAA